MTQNVGMHDTHADNSRHVRGPAAAIERLEEAGIGAFFRPADLEAMGLTRHQLRALVQSGRVERVARGLYRRADAEPTENYSIAWACARVPRSVVCLLSALRVHAIGTQSPLEVWLAIPHKARRPRLDQVALRVVRFSAAAWTPGVAQTRFEGVPARITNPARTVVDCFRYEHLIGPEVAMEALQDTLRLRKATVAEIARLEQRLPSKRLRAALDVYST